MRILVTGAAGMVGRCVLDAAGDHHVVAGVTHADLELADRDAVEQAVGTFRPDAVVNCAALADVDACEVEPDRAWGANALGVRHLAVAAERVGAHVVHVSTDYVFDGRSGPYAEWDDPCPVQVYGRSKLGGERELARHCSSWTIARTAWVFGPGPRDFVTWVLRAAAAGEELPLVEDQVSTPTYARDLAAALVRMAAGREQGLVHTCNEGPVTRVELARMAAGLAGVELRSYTTVPSSALRRPAERPLRTALDCTVLRIGGRRLRPVREALADHVGALVSGGVV